MAPVQERAQASVEAILLAAEQLLRDEGFTRMTTNRIAARAGVNVALVYRYFSGKEAIVGALIERVAERTYRAVQEAVLASAAQPLSVALRALLDALVHTPGVHPEVHRELVERIDMTKRRAHVAQLRTRLAALFAELLAARKGELRAFADQAALLFVLQHAIEAAAHAAAFYRPADLSAERTLDALVELLTRALLPLREAR